MIGLLATWLIRDHHNVASPRVRLAYGMLCGAVGIALNLLLFGGKLVAGARTGSIGVTADAFNNLSDAGSSVVTLIGFRLARSKADREHPFGHGRFEYIAGLIVSVAILLMGVELIRSSIGKIVSPEAVRFSLLSVGVLSASILIKLYMFFYNRSIGKKIASATMRAAALDSLSDVAATGVVLLSMFVARWTGWAVDGWAGLIVALFILYTGVMAARETIGPLLGQPPTAEYVRRVERIVLEGGEIVGVHDLVVHDYGPGRVMISLHAEVPADGDMIRLHDAVDNIEKRLRETLGCEAVIHMDPLAINDAETNRLRAAVEALVGDIDGCLTVHDFRVVAGHTHTNLIFDVVVPYGFRLSDEAVRAEITRGVAALEGNCFAVVEIDKSSV